MLTQDFGQGRRIGRTVEDRTPQLLQLRQLPGSARHLSGHLVERFSPNPPKEGVGLAS